ncbi:MAG: Spy/CpxP family protein refolding chaperone [Myxococcota bacterium]
MFGFIVGTVSLIALIKVLRRGRFGLWPHHGWVRRRLLHHLDATPSQEKVIRQALEEVEKAAKELRKEVFGSRSEFAQAIRGEHFDGEPFHAATARQQAAFEQLKKAALAGLQSVHEVLTPTQRGTLADLIEHGPHHGFGRACGCGPTFREPAVNWR